MEAYRWTEVYNYATIPSTALKGGIDIDGYEIYVGRAFYAGDWLPAKVIPGKNAAYVAYGGEEHMVDRFQILCETRFEWVFTSGNNIPHGCVEGGRTSDGETLYIGRVNHEGSQTIGKVHPSHSCCYIPFGGREISYIEYEILVQRT